MDAPLHDSLKPAMRSDRRRFSDHSARAADAIASVLVDHGVDVVFMLPGGMIAPVVDAIAHSSIRVVVARHEAHAVFMAIGHARMTQKPGVVLVTSGPGLTNTVTAVASAFADCVPLLVLAGEMQRAKQGKGGMQEGSAHSLNLVAAFKSFTKYAAEIVDAGAVTSMLVDALSQTTRGRPGPALLTIPLDVSSGQTHVAEYSQCIQDRFEVPPETARRCSLELLKGRRNLLFVGNGARAGSGPRLLREVAERLECPVMTTPKGKGVFPEDHPLHLGVFGLGGHPSTVEYLQAGVEVLVAIGTSLGDIQTNSWSSLLKPQRTLIHVDIDGARIGRAFPTNLSIEASADAFLASVLACLPSRSKANGHARSTSIRHHVPPRSADKTGPTGLISPIRAIIELQALLPETTIYTIDCGEHYLYATHYIECRRSDTYIVMTGLGSMGSSVGAAIGAAVALPDRQTCAVCGDGGFAMMATELETAARESIPVVIAVLNDHCLQMVKLGHEKVFGRTPDFSVRHLDVGALAEAVGCESVRIEKPDQLSSLRPMLVDRCRPLVLDIRIDPEVRLPKLDRIDKLVEPSKSVLRN